MAADTITRRRAVRSLAVGGIAVTATLLAPPILAPVAEAAAPAPAPVPVLPPAAEPSRAVKRACAHALLDSFEAFTPGDSAGSVARMRPIAERLYAEQGEPALGLGLLEPAGEQRYASKLYGLSGQLLGKGHPTIANLLGA